MNAHDTFDADVLIVGGGPVGMGLAIDLGQRGVRVMVAERYLEPQQVPKGQNLTQRTMEHFQAWRAEEQLRAARTIPPEYGIGGLTAYGTLLSGYHYDWLPREKVRAYYQTDNERLPQYATEAVLRTRAAEIPVIDARYGWTVEALEQDDDGARAHITERASEVTRTVRARWLVGCDGSRSLVRQQAGITETRDEHDRLMVLLVFRSTELNQMLEQFAGKSFYNVLDPALEGYWKFFGRVDLDATFFFHAPVPRSAEQGGFDFAAYLHGAVGAPFDVTLEHVGFWDLRIARADSYRAGRVLIAGDAAHSHPPYGGYGINTGFEDARNLGWKLAAEIAGWAGPDLLDSYDAERRPVFASTADDFIARSISIDRAFLAQYDSLTDRAAFEEAWAERAEGANTEVKSFAPHYRGSPVIGGQTGAHPSALGGHDFVAEPGTHLSPATLSSGMELGQALGSGFTLLAFDADPHDVSGFAQASARLQVPLDIIGDTFADSRARYAARLVLVRPDGFIAWSGDTADGAHVSILAQAIGGQK
jgi:2-polyprenyl-6-methoxyphenol hydroxylase-like FAD-dependent oxidoreductase